MLRPQRRKSFNKQLCFILLRKTAIQSFVVEFVFPSVVRACVRRPKSKCRLKTIPTTIVHCASKPRQKLSFFPKNLFYIQRHVLLSLSFTSSSFLPYLSLFLAREPCPLAEMRVRPKNKMKKKKNKRYFMRVGGFLKKERRKTTEGQNSTNIRPS